MNDSDDERPEGNAERASATVESTKRCQRDRKGPFVHRFETGEGKYVFDANTMCIVPVDEIAWEIILDVGVLTKKEVVAKYAGRFAADQITEAHDRLLERQREGYFLSRWPRVEFTLSEEQVREKLHSQRQILILNVTERCNFRCRYCSYDGRHKGRPGHCDREMAWSVAKQAIDEFLPHAVDTPSITFYGGEPLLNMDLIKECVSYAHQMRGNGKVHFGLTTNASLLTDEVGDYLVSENFSIGISLDGPREMHDRYRRTADDRPTWDLVAQNVREFLERYPRYMPHMLFMVTMAPPLDVEALETFFQTTDLLRRGMSLQVSSADLQGIDDEVFGTRTVAGYDKLRRRFLESLASGAINRDGQDQRYLFARRLFEKEFTRFHKRFQLGESIQTRRHFADLYCSLSNCIPGTRRTFVGAGGGYWPCERVPQSEYLRIGRVGEGLDVPKIHRMLREWVDMTKDQCETCWCLRECSMGCLATANNGDRPTPELKRSLCQSHQRGRHQLLVDYCRVLEKDPANFAYMDQITLS
jgi:uncharacterized protein